MSVIVLGLVYEWLWQYAAYAKRGGKTWAWANRMAPSVDWTEPPDDT